LVFLGVPHDADEHIEEKPQGQGKDRHRAWYGKETTSENSSSRSAQTRANCRISLHMAIWHGDSVWDLGANAVAMGKRWQIAAA
jgi:hypothetical protein